MKRDLNPHDIDDFLIIEVGKNTYMVKTYFAIFFLRKLDWVIVPNPYIGGNILGPFLDSYWDFMSQEELILIPENFPRRFRRNIQKISDIFSNKKTSNHFLKKEIRKQKCLAAA